MKALTNAYFFEQMISCLVWVSHLSPRSTQCTVLADSHLRMKTPRRATYVELLAVCCSTCVDVSSSAAMYGFHDLLAPVTEHFLLNLLISFAPVVMGYVLTVRCIEGTHHMMGDISPK